MDRGVSSPLMESMNMDTVVESVNFVVRKPEERAVPSLLAVSMNSDIPVQ